MTLICTDFKKSCVMFDLSWQIMVCIKYEMKMISNQFAPHFHLLAACLEGFFLWRGMSTAVQ